MKKKIVLATLACFIAAISLSVEEKKKDAKPQDYEEVVYNWTRTFAEVLNIAGQKHYKIANPEDCMVKAINSFLECLDPHSSFS